MLTRRNLLASSAALFTTNLFPRLARGANDRIAVGFIGTGGRGGDGLINDFLYHPDCQCVAVCDAFTDRRELRAKQIDDTYAKRAGAASYKSAAMSADFRELLRRKDIDAVAIATPDHWHVPLLVAAARAGKDVYVEKPLSPSIEQNRIARRVIHQTGRVFQYGTQQRGAMHVRLGCELVRGGRIGKLTGLEVAAPTGGPGGSTAASQPPEGFDYDLWLGPSPQRPYRAEACAKRGHYHIYDYSIGFLGGWGAHPLDVLDWGLPTPMVPVECEGAGLIPEEGLFDTVMRWKVTCRYADGLTLNFSTGSDSTKFIGEEGWIQIMRKGIESEPKSLTSNFPPASAFTGMGLTHVRNFLDSVRKQATPESHIDSAFRSDLISHLANIAVRTGRKVKWDPVKETIVGDPEAAKMMSRTLRKPWDTLL
jgi:glucose-fructose oxidoreductase